MIRSRIDLSRWAHRALAVAIGLFAFTAVAAMVILDDAAVVGNACIGLDCVNGENFGPDTLRLKENNLRIVFNDTTDESAGPSHDWRLTANSAQNGGATRFSIDDLDGTPVPFRGVEGSDIGVEDEATTWAGVADVDADGRVDALFANSTASPTYYSNNGTGSPFEGVTPTNITANTDDTRALGLGAFTTSAVTDVVKGNYGTSNLLVLNNGTADPFAGATTVDVTADSDDTTSIAIAFVSGGSVPEIVVGNEGQPNRLYRLNNILNPAAGFTGSDITADNDDTLAIAAADVNDDGFVDVVAGNLDEPNRLYLHNQSATPFSGVTGLNITNDADSTRAVAIADTNGDGFADVVVGNDGQPNRLYLGTGAADPFAGVTAIDIEGSGDSTTSLVLADLNADGAPDLLVGNDGEADLAFVNNGTLDPFEGVVGTPIGEDTGATTALAAQLPPFGAGFDPGLADLLIAANDGQVNRAHANDDIDGGTSPITIRGGAPDDSLTVDSVGRVGIGTASPGTGIRFDVVGDGRVSGDVLIDNGRKSGVVPRSAFSGGKTTTKVKFETPYEVPYAIVLTAVAKDNDAFFKPTVFKLNGNGFKFARNGPQSELVEFYWTTVRIGEY